MPVVNESAAIYRPCVVLACTDAVHAADTGRRMRRQGWDVYQAREGPEARRLARMLEAELVVLDVDLEGESGWLTCAKLTRERPSSRVILIGDEGARGQAMASFVGATALVSRQHAGLMAMLQGSTYRPRAAA